LEEEGTGGGEEEDGGEGEEWVEREWKNVVKSLSRNRKRKTFFFFLLLLYPIASL
jgi:hypothetical protein